MRLDAALYECTPPYSGKGRPRKKGQRLPTPHLVIENPDTTWIRLTLPWYGQPKRSIEIASATAVWYHTGLPAVPIRYVLIRDVLGKFKPQALLSTDLDLAPLDILTFFMRRWQMEPTFRHVREHLGVETQRQWSDKAIARTTPALLGLFSLVTILGKYPHLSSWPCCPYCCLVSQTAPDFFRCHCPRSSCLVGASDFSNLGSGTRYG